MLPKLSLVSDPACCSMITTQNSVPQVRSLSQSSTWRMSELEASQIRAYLRIMVSAILTEMSVMPPATRAAPDAPCAATTRALLMLACVRSDTCTPLVASHTGLAQLHSLPHAGLHAKMAAAHTADSIVIQPFCTPPGKCGSHTCKHVLNDSRDGLLPARVRPWDLCLPAAFRYIPSACGWPNLLPVQSSSALGLSLLPQNSIIGFSM